MAPQTAFYLLQGLETLPLRMARHVENARKVIAFLKDNPAVERIASPELPDHPDHALAQKLLPKGTGSIFSFDIKGGREAGRRFIETAATVLAPRQRGRRQVAGDPSRLDHACPARCGGARRRRGSARA